MSRTVKQRAAIKTNIKNEAAKISQSQDLGVLQTSLSKLRVYHERILVMDNTILGEIEGIQDIEKEVASAAEFDDWVLGVISTLETHVEKLKQPQKLAESADAAKISGGTPGSKAATVKLPKLEITKFSGDPMKWREFWDSFGNTIDKNEDLAEIDKFKYLKGYLDGDALRLCEGYTLSAANYDSVKSALGDRFGNPQLAIFSHLTALIEQLVASHSVKDLQKIYDESERHIRSLVGLGLREEQYGLVFTPIILSKLPLHVKMELHRQNGSDAWTLAKLRELLRQEIHARDMSERHFVAGTAAKNGKAADGKQQDNPKKGGTQRDPKFTGSVLSGSPGKKPGSGPRPCAFCNVSSHRSDQCPRYPDYTSRRQKLGKACINCLGGTHQAKTCRSKSSCFHCKKKGHHSSLCFSLFAPPTHNPAAGQTQQPIVPAFGAATFGGSGPSVNPAATFGGSGPSVNPAATFGGFGPSMNPAATPFTPTTNNSAFGVSDKRYTNMQTAIAQCYGSGSSNPRQLRLLFDTGGFRSYITSAAASSLGAKVIGQESMSLGVFGDKRRRNRTYDVVQFFVRANDGELIPIQANVTDFISCPVLSQPLDAFSQFAVSNFRLAEPPASSIRELPVDVLIGGDHYYDIVTSEQIRFSGGLVLLSSRVGYLVAGVSKPSYTPSSSFSGLALLSTSKAVDKDFDLEQFWRLEDIGIKDPSWSPEDEEALRLFSSSLQFENSMYQVKWPRKDNALDLPENRELALGRLRSLLRRLSSQPEILGKYGMVIQDQVNRGIIEIAPEQPQGPVHYLPHHCVVKSQSLTTPVRVVYDASAKSKSGNPSLNDTLYTGPLFLADLVGLLLRFRLNNIAVVSDIEKAYLQIGLQTTERDLVRFFWTKDPTKPAIGNNLIVYRFARVPFGIVCSAFLLGACLLHHFSHYSGSTARYLAENLYVDNIIVSLPGLESAMSYYQEAKQILSDASMNLRQWYTNSNELIDFIPQEDRGKGGRVTSVLGMVWDSDKDVISCPSFTLDPSSVRTKRQLIQFVAKVFDPCGLFSPVMAMGKILVQRSWTTGLGWDEELPEDILNDWKMVGPNILAISSCTVPRQAGRLKSSGEVTLHCFCDASTKCYATAVYLKSNEHGPCLLFSKTKVAPTKSRSKKELTIPQLELMAVVIGTRNLNFISNQLKLQQVRRIVWTDSQCVLHWVIRKNVSTVFVKNRVKEISQAESVEFRYVRSEDNPADLASRGCSLDILSNSNVWWHGPDWLALESSKWEPLPDSLHISSEVLDDRLDTSSQVQQLSAAPHLLPAPPEGILSLFNVEKFSELPKLLRVLAWVLRFISTSRKFNHVQVSSRISAEEISFARQRFERAVQARHFSDILTGNPSSKSKLLIQQLGIQKDQDGVLRCTTRLASSSDVHPSTVRPILLPSDDHYSRLVIQDIHEKLFHCGTAYCLSELRQTHWIPKGRAKVKSVVDSCKLCRKLKALRFKYPAAPPLPAFRVSKSEVFDSTGLDYLGPLYIRSFDGDRKVWILLLTCTVVRAIHLEVVEDMSTQQFLLAFRRFGGLYGYPSLIVSDNAKQFKTADAVFRRVCFSDSVQQYTASKGIKWKFIPERAPWFGGFYERLVGLVKRCLRSALHMSKVSLAELQTIVYEVSACLNTRPITYVESDTESVPLCPANFLLKGRSVQILAPDEEGWELPAQSTDRELVLTWRRNKALLDKFWSIWQKSYLTALKERQRVDKQANTRNVDPQIGMTVLIADKKPKGQWQLARIIKLHQSGDGRVRSADVILPSGLKLKRPVKLLCPLEASNIDNTSTDAEAHAPEPKRTTRRAAIAGRERTRAMLRSDTDGENGDETGAQVFVALLSIPSFVHASNETSFSDMEDTEERRVCFVNVENEERRYYYVANDDPGLGLFGVRHPGFFVGEQMFPSVFMAIGYVDLVQDGYPQLASDMHFNPQLRKYPHEIPAWLKERGYEPSAKMVFVRPQVIQDIFKYDFVREGPLRDAIEEAVAQQGIRPTDLIHSCGPDYVWDCGLRFNNARYYPRAQHPGFDKFGIALERIIQAYLDQDFTPNWDAEALVSQEVVPQAFAEKTVLVISDSICKHIKDIEGRGTVIFRRGGTFRDLARRIRHDNIWFGDYNYVVVHCGINDVQKGLQRAEQFFMEFLDYIETVQINVRGYPPNRILISCPLRHPEQPGVLPFSFFVEGHCLQRGIKCCNWANLPLNDDPFIQPHYYMWNARTSARDWFHINHAGLRELWKAWCKSFPQLKCVGYALLPEHPPRRRRRAGRNHQD